MLIFFLGCQVQFYDIPGRRYHISKAYVQYSLPLPDCRDRCAGDENCWALMFYNTTNMCALTNLTVVFGYSCDYCFSAKKGPCINRKYCKSKKKITSDFTIWKLKNKTSIIIIMIGKNLKDKMKKKNTSKGCWIMCYKFFSN